MRTKYLHQSFALLVVCLIVLTLIVIHWKPVHAAPATFTVTNTDASGLGSLAQAISDANSNANPSEQDTIEFDISATGNVEIRPSAQLTISEPVIIDGYTQSDATANTQDWPQPFDGILRVGVNLSDVDPISVESNDVTIQGLVIYDDEGDDVSTTTPGNVVADGIDNLKLYGNYFDTLHNGLSNAKSITSRKSVILTDTTNVTIGGTAASQRNIFGHCALSCIEGSGSGTAGLRLKGNYIGLGSDGVTSLDNYAPGNYGGAGVVLSDGGSDVVIGGSGTAGNSFEHNYWGALSVEDFDDVSVLGNRVLFNTRADGHGNQLNGAGIFFGGVTNSVIGSETAPNIIAGNYQGTITIDSSTDAGLGNQISDNVAVQYNLIGVLDDEGTSFPNSDGVRIEGGSQDILFSHNTVKNTADPDYTSDYGIYVSESSVATILDNSIYNNELLGIDLDHTITPSHPAPTYSWIEESGGDSEITFSLNTTVADDYRIQFFGNTVPDASGAGEGETLLGSTNITHTGSGIEVFTYTLTGVVDIENLALTATTIDAGATHGYGSTSEFGGFQPQADLEIYTSAQSSTVEEGTEGFYIQKVYINNGPNTITDIEYNFLFSVCFTVTSVATDSGGNATDFGTYDMGEDTWTGVLESGQFMALRFYGDVSCLAGNGIFFQHYYTALYSYGNQVQELYDDNETVVANPSIIRTGDLSVSTSSAAEEVYTNNDAHDFTQTITNEGSSTITDIDFGLSYTICYTITSVLESGTATDTGTYTASPDYDWTGILEPGQTLILTFTGEVSCGGDNTITFGHYISSMQDDGIDVTDTNNGNEYTFDSSTSILWLETDLDIVTDDGSDTILVGTTGHEITQTITNDGPIALSDIYFYEPNINCATLTNVTVSGTATNTGAYDDENYIWTGLLEVGQNLVLTFIVDESCGGGNNLYFNQTRNYLELNGDVVAEITATNEDYDDTTAIVAPTSDFSITKTLNNPEDLAEGAELEYTITLTNNGPQDMDISMYDGQFNGFGGFNVLFYDFMPPEITYTSWSSADDVECFGTSSNNFPAPISQPLGPGSAANLGPAFGNHSDYEIVMCNESTGVENVLGNGESISGTLTATVTGSDLDFTNYAFANMGQNDPTQALYAGYDGNSDLIDFIEGVDGNFNNLVKSLPVSDLRLEKELVEPFAGNEPGETVSYDMTVYNDGPMDVDLTLLDGSLGTNNIVGDFYPGADLTYVDDDNDDVTCVDLGPGSIAYVGSVGEDHPDHQILMCVFTGSSGTLAAGASLTIRTSFTVNESVGTGYTNYAAVGGLSTDVDVIALNSTYGSATGDILDEIDNENFAAVTYTDPDYVDNDGDGVRNGLEDAAPNSGDANDDGTADKEQDNVTSYLNEVTGEYVTLAVDDSCSISTTSMSSESGSEGDSAYNYPLGLMNFSLSCGSNGYTAAVTMYYYSPDGASYTLRKYNPNSNTYTTIPGATVTSTTIDSSPVVIGSYQIEDGGALDTDGVANGTIVDPAGLGVKVASSPDTTSDSGGLSSTGTSVLVVLLVAVSLLGVSTVMHSVKRVSIK